MWFIISFATILAIIILSYKYFGKKWVELQEDEARDVLFKAMDGVYNDDY